MRHTGGKGGTLVQNNIVLEAGNAMYFENYSNDNSSTYDNHTANGGGSAKWNGGEFVIAAPDTEDYVDNYTFTTDNFTNNPRTITLTNVAKP